MLDLAASRGLQIIVLSCTPADYTALGAKQIFLRRERPVLHTVPPPPEPIENGNLVLSPLPPPIPVSSEQRERLLAALQDLGGSAGNQTLREALGWEEGVYEAVKSDLVERRQLFPGKGRGGSVGLPGAAKLE